MLWILTFLPSCEYAVAQAQLAALFGLNGTKSIPVTLIASFAANDDPKMAYKQLCEGLCQIGITGGIIRQKEDKILEILRSQGMVASSRIVASDTRNEEDQIIEAAYEQFCKELFQIGVTEDLIPPRYKVLGILKSRGMVASHQSSGSNMGGKGKLGC